MKVPFNLHHTLIALYWYVQEYNQEQKHLIEKVRPNQCQLAIELFRMAHKSLKTDPVPPDFDPDEPLVIGLDRQIIIANNYYTEVTIDKQLIRLKKAKIILEELYPEDPNRVFYIFNPNILLLRKSKALADYRAAMKSAKKTWKDLDPYELFSF